MWKLNMADIINKFYKKIANNGNDSDYELVGEIGVNGMPLEEYLNQRFQSILGEMYPVGSIYLSVKNENPSTKFGGTWVAWGSGRVPVGVNSSDSSFKSSLFFMEFFSTFSAISVSLFNFLSKFKNISAFE